MRRVSALALMALLAACTSIEDMAPVASRTDVSVTSKITRAYPRFSDSDPHDWSGNTPWNYAVHGTDVSKYQTSVDWREGKGQRHFLRLHQGDRRWRPHRRLFLRALARHQARRRAAQRLSLLLFLPPSRRAGRLVHPKRSPRPFRPAAGARHGMEPAIADLQAAPPRSDRAQRNAHISRNRRETLWQEADHLHVDRLLRRQQPFDLPRLPLLAAFSCRPPAATKYGSHPFTFWQYTGTGVVPGIKGNADINVFNGRQAAWRKWLKANTH